MADLIDLQMMGDYLSLGGLGFVFGVALPFGFRLIGYFADGILKFFR